MDPGAADEEVLDARPRSRWLIVLLAAFVAAAVVRIVVADSGRRSPEGGPIPRPGPTGNPPPVQSAAVTSVEVIAQTVGDSVYAVDAGVLIRVDLRTGRRLVVHANAGDAMDGTYTLLADPGRQRVWLARAHDDQIELSWFDTRTRERVGLLVVRGALRAAAVLDGRLYLSTSRGVVAVADTGASSARPELPAVDLLAADPARHRLLFGDLDAGRARLAARRPAVGVPDGRGAAPFGKGQLVVAGGQIWAAGFGAHRSVLERLDPRTLRAQVHSPLERTLGPGVLIVQAGGRHLLVRDGVGGNALWCVDAGTGEITHYWPAVAGVPVLAARGVFALVAGEPLARLDSSGCAG